MSNRRQFLTKVALGSVGIISARPSIFFNFNKPKEKYGVALVGLGGYSTHQLAPALQKTQQCYLAGVVTGTPAKATTWQDKYQLVPKNVYNYENFDSIANNPDIDIVYVVLPNHLHKEFTIRAAEAGKHVWCEKPMAMNAGECQDMIAACQKNKVTLSIGYRMQHEPITQEVIKYAQQKTFGKPKLVQTGAGFVMNATGVWRLKKAMGGGAMFDMGVYALQGARYSTGEEPINVQATILNSRPEMFSEVDETTLFTLEFPSGALAQCATSLGMNMGYLNITYEKGWCKVEPFQSYNGIAANTKNGPIEFKVDNQQAKYMDDNCLSIRQKQPLLVPGEEGLRDMVIVDAIFKSAQDRRLIKL